MPETAEVEVDVVEEDLNDEAQQDEVEQGTEEVAETAQTEQADEEEVEITIGDEPPPGSQDDENAEPLVPKLRRLHREEAQKRREAERKLAEAEAKSKPAPADELGARPTLAGSDYDEDKLAEDLLAWNARKSEIEARRKAEDDAKAAQAKAWQEQVDTYQKLKTELKVKDIDVAEAEVFERLSEQQRGIVVASADNPALVVYALSRSETHLTDVSKITDPLKFAKAIWKLEQTVKVTTRKATTPPPEKRVTGSAPIAGAVDGVLQRLRADADRTGDRSKVTAYMRQKAAAKG